MKWRREGSIKPVDKERRVKSGFLWVPKYTYVCVMYYRRDSRFIKEWRWLEYATWEDVYSSINDNWTAVKWL